MLPSSQKVKAIRCSETESKPEDRNFEMKRLLLHIYGEMEKTEENGPVAYIRALLRDSSKMMKNKAQQDSSQYS
jgi:hypothetical protein